MHSPDPYKSGFFRGLVLLALSVCSGAGSVAMGAGATVLAPGAELLKAWQMENLEGDFVGAAEEYYKLYRRSRPSANGEAGQSSSATLDRLRAAYRAGLCFEAVGNLNRARSAYQWLERNHSRLRIDLLLNYPGNRELQDFLTMLKERSALRFSSLKEPEAQSELDRVAIAVVLEKFREYNRGDTNNLESFRQQILEQRWRVAAADELAAELDRGGVTGFFSDRLDSSGPRGEELRSLVTSMQKVISQKSGDKPYDLRGYLRSCFLQRALDALALEETDRAGRELSVALVIDPDYRPALSLQAILDGRGAVTFLATSALLRSERREKLRASEVRRQARSLVSKAESLDRRDQVLHELFRASRVCYSETASVLADEEISRLRSRVKLGCIERAGVLKKKEVEEMLVVMREQIRSSLGLCEELVSLSSRVLFQKNYLLGEGLSEAIPAPAIIGVAQAIKNETRDARVRSDKLRLDRLEFKLALLEGWFPEIKELIKTL